MQLFAPPINHATHLCEKIPFINPEKPFNGCLQSAHKYYGRVRVSVRVNALVRVSVTVRVSLV